MSKTSFNIVWPPEEKFDYIVGFEDIEKNKEYFEKLGNRTIQLVPNQKEHNKDRSEK